VEVAAPCFAPQRSARRAHGIPDEGRESRPLLRRNLNLQRLDADAGLRNTPQRRRRLAELLRSWTATSKPIAAARVADKIYVGGALLALRSLVAWRYAASRVSRFRPCRLGKPRAYSEQSSDNSK
jgi:hypothetical protein